MNGAIARPPSSYRPLSIAGGIRAAMYRNPAKVAVRCGDAERSYRDLVARIDKVSTFLLDGLGLPAGAHGVILAGSSIEYLEIVAGASQAGIPLATVNPRLSPREAEEICEDSGARVLFVDQECAEQAREHRGRSIEHVVVIGDDLERRLADARPRTEYPPVHEWEPFTIPYTSGTTGKPKGVLVSHRSRILSFYGMAAEYGCYSPDDRFLGLSPLCHGGGMGFGLAPVYFGGHLELCARFDPEQALRRLDEGAVTGAFMVPTHFHDIFALDGNREAGPGEVGELYSSSPFLFNGYWRKPEETAQAFRDGWVSVGDLARRDEEGYLYIVDRKKDMVITGGVNVYPSEIEEVLARHPDVAEAAVVGVPHERWGESLEAFVTVRPGATLDREQVARFCGGRLARFKVPKKLVTLPELPRNAAGKILKSELRNYRSAT